MLPADRLEPSLGFLDRVQVVAAVGGLDTLVVVNRVDLVADSSTVEDLMARYLDIDLPVVWTSATRGDDLDDLAITWQVSGRPSAATRALASHRP